MLFRNERIHDSKSSAFYVSFGLAAELDLAQGEQGGRVKI